MLSFVLIISEKIFPKKLFQSCNVNKICVWNYFIDIKSSNLYSPNKDSCIFLILLLSVSWRTVPTNEREYQPTCFMVVHRSNMHTYNDWILADEASQGLLWGKETCMKTSTFGSSIYAYQHGDGMGTWPSEVWWAISSRWQYRLIL